MVWGCWCTLGTQVCFFPHLFFGTVFCISLSLSKCCMIWRRVLGINGFGDPPLLVPDRDCSFLCLGIASLEVTRKERVITKRVSLPDVAHGNIQNGLRITQPHRFPFIFLLLICFKLGRTWLFFSLGIIDLVCNYMVGIISHICLINSVVWSPMLVGQWALAWRTRHAIFRRI